MFLTHADETHNSFFPKVFPINPAETESYPDLSKLEAIYHTCPIEQYKINSIPAKGQTIFITGNTKPG